MNILSLLLSKFRTWKEAEVEHPLTRENAYVLASISKKKGNYVDVTKEYQKWVLRVIETNAKIGDNYAYIKHPSFATPTDKQEIVEFLNDLNYSVCFINEDVLLVSWKYSPGDFITNDRQSK